MVSSLAPQEELDRPVRDKERKPKRRTAVEVRAAELSAKAEDIARAFEERHRRLSELETAVNQRAAELSSDQAEELLDAVSLRHQLSMQRQRAEVAEAEVQQLRMELMLERQRADVLEVSARAQISDLTKDVDDLVGQFKALESRVSP